MADSEYINSVIRLEDSTVSGDTVRAQGDSDGKLLLSPTGITLVTGGTIDAIMSGTATTVAATVTFTGESALVLVDNLSSSIPLIVSFDGGVTYKTIPVDSSWSWPVNATECEVATNSGTADYEIAVILT